MAIRFWPQGCGIPRLDLRQHGTIETEVTNLVERDKACPLSAFSGTMPTS
jgi:hypothetical protein